MIGLGVIGCGWAASEIARSIVGLGGLRIVASTDRDAGRAVDFAARTGARVASGVEDVLGDPAVTAVYVGTPHHLLADIAERALRAGRHVLCEKPLALTAADAHRLGRLAEQCGLKLAVFFELRRSGPIAAARKLVQDGAIGVPRFVRIRTIIDKPLSYWGPPESPSWRSRLSEAGGGVLLMNSIHQLDTLRYVTGLDYVRASGDIATFTAPAEVEDVASATLRLSNGGIVSIAAAAHSPGGNGQETIEIDGSAGRLDMPYPYDSGILRLYRLDTADWTEIAAPPVDMHAAMLGAFLEAIETDGPPPAVAADAAQALAAVMGVYRSATEGRVVELEG